MADTKLYDVLGVSKNASDLEIKKVRCYSVLLCQSFMANNIAVFVLDK